MKKQVHGGDVYTNKGVLDFSSNVNPLGPPPSVIKAAKESINSIEHYPDVKNRALAQALSDYEEVPSSYIVFGNGAAEVIFSFVRAIDPSRALLCAPTFSEYGAALRAAGCEAVYSLIRDSSVKEDFLDLIDPRLDAVFLCNPNNPTGFLLDKGLLERIIGKCQENKIFLLVDECFLDFVHNGKDHSVKKFLKDNDHLFILNSFTKRYAMAGLRLGYGLCSNRILLDRMEEETQPWNISLPAQAAGKAALKEKEYVEKARETVNEERAYLKEEMKKAGLYVYDSQANYIFFQGPEDLYERCLDKGILIRDCSNYEGLKAGYFRIAVRKREENDKLLETFREILRN